MVWTYHRRGQHSHNSPTALTTPFWPPVPPTASLNVHTLVPPTFWAYLEGMMIHSYPNTKKWFLFVSFSGEALKCIMCQGFHHMLCINPPMLRKPSKGFAFQCALCTKLAMDSASSSPTALKQSPVVNNSAASSGQNSPRGSPKQKSVATLTVVPATRNNNTRNDAKSLLASAPSTSQDQKMSHMWPFRYFGTHADIQDIFGMRIIQTCGFIVATFIVFRLEVVRQN